MRMCYSLNEIFGQHNVFYSLNETFGQHNVCYSLNEGPGQAKFTKNDKMKGEGVLLS